VKTVAVIPARFASSRFPGKPLVPLLGKPMVLWVAELSAVALGRESVHVATEDERIAEVVRAAGFSAVMTSRDALTGTDRLAEFAEQVEADCYINVQGDEPVLEPQDIRRIADAKVRHPDRVINGWCWIGPEEDAASVNIPKVVATENGAMIYMSRRPLPGYKDTALAPPQMKKQVCIYAFDRPQLRAFRQFGRKTETERCEDIEILRFLDLGIPVQMVETSGGSLAVDVPEDIGPVERALKRIHRL
jgi:3-deoxy-manno-octulosonate cytidylyltransferase (CMP-KDO synthetase)